MTSAEQPNVTMGSIPEDKTVDEASEELYEATENFRDAVEAETTEPEPEVEVVGDGPVLVEDQQQLLIPFEDENNPDEKLYGDGPTKSQVEEWKKRYSSVIVSTFPDEQYVVWRPLTRPEYRALSQELEDLMGQGMGQVEARFINEEQTVEVASLYPQYTRDQDDNEIAGIASLIAQQVMEASGFVALEVQAL